MTPESDQWSHHSSTHLLPSGANTPAKSSWVIEQAMFAVMGGFAITTPYIDRHGKECTISRLVASEGVTVLAKTGYLPTIQANDVEERSKADLFAKMLVLIQILWFALQVVARLIQGITVTPLETHTAIHVGCAILLYAIWFNKPYNLTQSIEGESGYEPPPRIPELKPLPILLEEYNAEDIEHLRFDESSDEDVYILHGIAPNARQGLHILESRGCDIFRSIHEKNQPLDVVRESAGNFNFRSIWGSWSADLGHEPSLEKVLHVLFNVIYGGFHLAGWNYEFPTVVEQWLWRISALCLVTSPLWGALWILWWMGVRSSRKCLFAFRDGDLDIVAAPFFFMVIISYTMARTYFLVISLASLRLLPKDAYDTVNWTSVFPHFS
ncbi:hypothetical protein PENSTE_c005G03676 [Penicillium steckii]|uniref:Uncharacterized protein n=1 Tax=Penicillium steckii TaxID=303698 RepID=A0A1V6TJM0_9EURO|nr:hypothetical protein PENSTE_c005G03676 [Penicillium steckii]